MSTHRPSCPPPEGPGSVSGAPNLPAGFTDTFTSRYIDTGELRLHAVIGGDGPPLLLVHGWPETWYAWRLLMPALARDFEVIAVDQRGIGLSDKPAGRLRHRHPRRRPGRADGRARPRAVRRGRPRHRVRDQLRAGRGPPGPGRPRGLAEIPGSPGAAPSPPVFVPAPINDRLWHLPFNRLERTQRAARRRTRGHLLRLGVRRGRQEAPRRRDRLLRRPALEPRRPCAAASGSTGRSTRPSRRTSERKTTRLTMPVLAIGGAASFGEHVGEAMELVADDVQSRGHPRHRPLRRRGGSRRRCWRR